MSISGISGSSVNQMYQYQAQSAGNAATQRAQQTQAQGSTEESQESAAEKNHEAITGGESQETRSINTYA